MAFQASGILQTTPHQLPTRQTLCCLHLVSRPAQSKSINSSCSSSSGSLCLPQTLPAKQRYRACNFMAGAGSMPESGSQQGMHAQDEAVVVVDHGSRRQEANDMLDEFVELYRQQSGRSMVEGAHMELASPTIADAIKKCADAGAKRIIVAPYFLSRGRHIQEDIPRMVEEAATEHPGITCRIAKPIGIDSLMADLIEKRVQDAAKA